MSLDYRAAIENQAWALLEASMAFANAFAPGNRIKMSGDGWLRAWAKGAPADYPQIKVELGNGSTPNIPRVFGQNSVTYRPSVNVDFGVPITQQLKVTLTYDIVKTTSQTPLEAIVESVLMGAWPKFGLSYVSGFTHTSSRKDVKVSGVQRQQTTFVLSFNLRPMMSQLVA